MSINQALSISRTGLLANQTALTVVSQNIANMNTEGYSKLRTETSEFRLGVCNTRSEVPAEIASLAGVEVTAIKSYANIYLNNYYRTQNSQYEGFAEAADIATNVTTILDEISDSNGLDDKLNSFYESVNALNQTPTDSALRINFVQKANDVAEKFNELSTNLTNYQEEIIGNGTTFESAENSLAGDTVTEINNKLESLAEINNQIRGDKSNNALQNERDLLLSDLSSLLNITSTISASGAANVKLGDAELVTESEVTGILQITPGGASPPATFNILKSDGMSIKYGDVNDTITGGKLGGIIQMTDSSKEFTIQGTLDKLDKLANAFADTLNTIQLEDDPTTQAMAIDTTTMTLTPATEPLFITGSADPLVPITADNIKINPDIVSDPYQVAAARVDTTATDYDPSAIGNTGNLTEILNARGESVLSLGNQTVENFYSSLVTKTGLETNQLSSKAKSQGLIVDSITEQIQTETGVNLDEELSDMIRFQRAYQASARVFSTCCSLLEELVNLGK